MKNGILLFPTLILIFACLAPEFPESAPGGTGEPRMESGDMDESRLEVRIFRILNGSLVNPVFDFIMPIVTNLHRWRIILVLAWSALVILGGSKGRWAALMLIPLVAASDQISSQVIKPLVGRIRPCEILGNVHLWYGPEGWITTPSEALNSYKSSFSFPSGHATNITSSMLFLGLVYRRLMIPLLVIAVLVSFSRIYIGVHWGSDAAVGMILGTALAVPAYIIFKRINMKNTGDTTKEKETRL